MGATLAVIELLAFPRRTLLTRVYRRHRGRGSADGERRLGRRIAVAAIQKFLDRSRYRRFKSSAEGARAAKDGLLDRFLGFFPLVFHALDLLSQLVHLRTPYFIVAPGVGASSRLTDRSKTLAERLTKGG